jgi:hypothetical protein
MNLRVALIFILIGFVGMLLAMGLLGFVQWLKRSYPRHFGLILTALVLFVVGALIWVVSELAERPSFRSNDLITLHEPVVARTTPAGRDARVSPCIVENSEHLAVLEIDGRTLKVRVESNSGSAPVHCVIGSEVHIALEHLHRYSLTRR